MLPFQPSVIGSTVVSGVVGAAATGSFAVSIVYLGLQEIFNGSSKSSYFVDTLAVVHRRCLRRRSVLGKSPSGGPSSQSAVLDTAEACLLWVPLKGS